MSSTNSSRSNSPIFSSTLAEFDYIRALEKHSGLDAILPPEGTKESTSTRSPELQSSATALDVPRSAPWDPSSKHPQVRRTFSQLEESTSTAKSRPSIVSALMNFGARPSASRTRSSARQTIFPSDFQTAPAACLGQTDIESGRLGGDWEADKKRRLQPDSQEPQYIVNHVEGLESRRKFILKLAKALLSFGAPSHRIESQLVAASEILNAKASFVHIPNTIIVALGEANTMQKTRFVRAGGRIALTNLHRVHEIYRDVLHDKIGAEAGADALAQLLRAPPIYPLILRCALAFICSSIICVLGFGGCFVDMFVSGACASFLQYLGLNAAAKSSMYANVYEISVSIIVSFVARGLSAIPGKIFCYNSISSAGVVLILPGFTVLISSLEITSRNILCGSVRMVYAIIYTLFLGFGLTLGSDLFLAIDRHARHKFDGVGGVPANLTMTHGHFTTGNGSSPFVPIGASFGFASAVTFETRHMIKGCFRDPSWPWWRQPVPLWAYSFLVPIYSTSSSLQNLQSWRSKQLPVMVLFSCISYAANKSAGIFLPGRSDIVSAAGALVIGALGNTYSRVIRGTAFTSMVTGVLFLVPSALAQGGGLTVPYRRSSTEQYSTGFSLALRMIQVAIGVTIGLFISQIVVYASGRRKNAAHFAF